MIMLRPKKEFASEAEFIETMRLINTLLDQGALEDLGRAEPGSPFMVRRFLDTRSLETWVLAQPDQAFRGYLKKDEAR